MTDPAAPDMGVSMDLAHLITPRMGPPAIMAKAKADAAAISILAVFKAERTARGAIAAEALHAIAFFTDAAGTLATAALIRTTTGRLIVSPFRFVRFADSDMERPAAAALAQVLKIQHEPGQAAPIRKRLTVAMGSVFSLRPAFPKRSEFGPAADILAGIGVIMPARADSFAAAVFQTANGQLRAAEIAERPALPQVVAAAILAAARPHLRGKSNG